MKKRLITAFALICLLLIVGIAGAYADYAVVTNTSSLNLRSGPGYEYQIVGTASRNDWVSIQQALGGWDYVTVVRTGQTGYMVDSFLKRESGGASGVGVVSNPSSSGFLNLREYPSYSAKVLGIYYNGATCQVISQSNGWYMVEIDGMLGYFRQEYLKVSGGTVARVTAANGKPVNLRSGPSMSYSVTASIPVNDQVTVLLKGNGFWYVHWQDVSGYMSSAYLSEAVVIVPSGDTQPETDGYLIVASPNAGKVNMRAQPSTSAKVLMQYTNGTRLEVIEGGLNWCKVYGKSSGLTGYIMTRFTKVYGLPGTPMKTVSNGKSYVNLRSAPSAATGKVLYRINSDEKVTVLVPGDEWTQVRYGDYDGYMMTCFLK